MVRRRAMKEIRRVIELHVKNGLSVRQIAKATGVSRTTVSEYIQYYRASDKTLEEIVAMSDNDLCSILYKKRKKSTRSKDTSQPNYAYIHTELRRRGVTRQLLWEEYRQQHPDGLGYSQFCQLYKEYKKSITVTMRQVHKAGEKLFIDYSGDTVPYVDSVSGETRQAEVFVAVLGASSYTFAEASADQKKFSFINSHIHAFTYFGGVPKLLIPDNLKSAVSKADFYEATLNDSYDDMASYYGTYILPARPYKPKDKGKAEVAVLLVQRWILARLRNHHFIGLESLNDAIGELLELLNNKVMRDFGKSRRQLFEELDKPALQALPPMPYLYREYKVCRVNLDYHIQLEGALYSVPYQLAHKEVGVYYNADSVEIYFENKRVAVHPRLKKKGAIHTEKSHMASSHRAYAEWTPQRIINWGRSLSPATGELLETILAERRHPELGFRTCLGIIREAKAIKDPELIEQVARYMLKLGSFKVKFFKNIVKNKSYLQAEAQLSIPLPEKHDNIRGASHYE
jgi:transposase